MRVPKKFVNLHSHSGFSIGDGLDYPQEHIDFIIGNGGTAWALTDHGNMNGFAHAYLHVEKLNKAGANFKFIPGCEMYVHPDLKLWELQKSYVKAKKGDDPVEIMRLEALLGNYPASASALINDDLELEVEEDDDTSGIEDESATKQNKFLDPLKRRHHMIVLPKDSIGLERLFGLVSKGYSEGFYRFPRIDYKMLKEAADGDHLLITTACIGGPLSFEIFKHFGSIPFDELKPSLVDNEDMMEKCLESVGNAYEDLVDAVGIANVFIELQFNKLNSQHLVNRVLLQFAKENGIEDKLVVTCDSHYSSPERWQEREVYKMLAWMNKKKDITPDDLPQTKQDLKCELYPKNEKQIWESYLEYTSDYDFYDNNLICDAIERSHEIAYELISEIHPDKSVKLTKKAIPEGMTARDALIEFTKKGLIAKGLHKDPVYVNQVKKELSVIFNKNFEEYFLTTKMIVDIAKKELWLGGGRGSGAGSLVNYCLGITGLDPLKYGLYFSRFLDETRSDYPDIDIDFSDRDRLIQMLKEELGENSVIPISNFNRFQLKSLVKDMVKLYGGDFQEVNTILTNLDKEVLEGLRSDGRAPDGPLQLTLEDAMEFSPSFYQLMQDNPNVYKPLEGLWKQNKALGKHAGGVIVADNILNRLPVIQTKGALQTPWVEGASYKHLEEFGWIKFDLLGLGTLRILQRGVELILKRHLKIKEPTFEQVTSWYEKHLGDGNIDWNDQEVYKVYSEAKFCGIFQCTNDGAQRLFQNAQPNNILDIAALTAIYRPGPLAMQVDKRFVKAKQDPTRINYSHPNLQAILGETYGEIVFQEQVMRIVNEVAGIPLEECNSIRKMMKPQQSSAEATKKAKALKDRIMSGFESNGMRFSDADELYEKIMKFTQYSFNKSHALAYAMISYQCAWMMTYYEEEWLCAYMEYMQNEKDDKKSKAIHEVKALGYDIVPIDINYAEKEWKILPGKKFMPSFGTVKGIGETAIEEIMEQRPYTSISDILYDSNKKWKLSKFNKRAFEALVKIQAFESLDMVGKGKLFDNYNHLLSLTENWSSYKKVLKKNLHEGWDILHQTIEMNRGIRPFTRKEIVKYEQDLLGTVNIETVIPNRYYNRFKNEGWKSIDDDSASSMTPIWFIVTKQFKKKTKNGKDYLRLEVMGANSKKEWLNVWSWNGIDNIEPFTVCVAILSKNKFGYSTKWNQLEIFVE